MRIQDHLITMPILYLCFSNSLSLAQSDTTALQLAEKESEFARSAAAGGFISAFLSAFDEDCIGFYPEPENARRVLHGEPESHSSLVWRPAFVEVSSSGDFGFTTGPSGTGQAESTTRRCITGILFQSGRKTAMVNGVLLWTSDQAIPKKK